MKKSLLTFLLLLLAIAIPAVAADLTFTGFGSIGLPTAASASEKNLTVTDQNGTEYTLTIYNCKSQKNGQNTAIFVTKGSGYILLPEFSQKIEKITLYSMAGASSSAPIVVYDGDSSLGTITLTTANLTTPYSLEIPADKQKANVSYKLKSDNTSKNVQISKIVVTLADAPAGPELKVTYDGTEIADGQEDLSVYYGDEITVSTAEGATVSVTDANDATVALTDGKFKAISELYSVSAELNGTTESVTFTTTFKAPEAPVLTFNGTQITESTYELPLIGSQVGVTARGAKYISVMCADTDPVIEEDVPADGLFTIPGAGEYLFEASNGVAGTAASSRTITFSFPGPELNVQFNDQILDESNIDVKMYYGEEISITAAEGAKIKIKSQLHPDFDLSYLLENGKFKPTESGMYTVSAELNGKKEEQTIYIAEFKKPEMPVITTSEGTAIEGDSFEVAEFPATFVLTAKGARYMYYQKGTEARKQLFSQTGNYTLTIDAADTYTITAAAPGYGPDYETSRTITFTAPDPNKPTAPTFTLQGDAQPDENGCYAYAQMLFINCQEGATLKYQINGGDIISTGVNDEPLANSWQIEFRGSNISADGTVNVKAWACKEGYDDVAAEATYKVKMPEKAVFTPESGSTLYTDGQITIANPGYSTLCYTWSYGEFTSEEQQTTAAETILSVSELGVQGGQELTINYYGLVSADKFEEGSSVTYTIAEKPAKEVYALLTDINDLKDGTKILVVGENGTKKYLPKLTTTNSGPSAGEVTLTEGTIVLDPEESTFAVFTLEEGKDSNAGKFALKNQEGNYWVCGTSGTATKWGTTPYYGSITIDGTTQHKIYLNSTRWICLNNTTDFRAYTSNTSTTKPVFVYVLQKPKEPKALTGVSISVDESNTVSISYEPEDAYPVPTVTYTINGGEATEYTGTFRLVNPTPAEETQVTVAATAVQGEGESAVTINADPYTATLPAAAVYTLVTDMAQIETGAEYVMVAERDGQYYAAMNTINSNNKIETVEVTVNDNTCTEVSGVAPYIIEFNGGKYYLKSDDKYLSHESSSSTNVNLNTTGTPLTIEIDGNFVKITGLNNRLLLLGTGKTTAYTIGMYAGSNYDSSNYSKISLYKRDGVAAVQHVSSLAEANQFDVRYVLDSDATVIYGNGVKDAEHSDLYVKTGDEIKHIRVNKASHTATKGNTLKGIAFELFGKGDAEYFIPENLLHLTASKGTTDVQPVKHTLDEVETLSGYNHADINFVQIVPDGNQLTDIFGNTANYEIVHEYVEPGNVEHGTMFNVECIIRANKIIPIAFTALTGADADTFETPVAEADFTVNGNSDVVGCGYEFTTSGNDVAVFYTKSFAGAKEVTDFAGATADNGRRDLAEAEMTRAYDYWAASDVNTRPALYSEEYYSNNFFGWAETDIDSYFGKTFRYDGEFIIAPENLWGACYNKTLTISHVALRKTVLTEIPAGYEAHFFEVPASHFATAEPQDARARAVAEGNVIAVKSAIATADGGTTTGVEHIGVEADSNAEYYNLQGVRVASDNLTPGLYIRRSGRTATKVMIR